MADTTVATNMTPAEQRGPPTESFATNGGSDPTACENLTHVETTALEVAWFRSRAANRFRRPDGLPYYDGSYDTALLNGLQAESVAEKIRQFEFMENFMLTRTAEIDELVMNALRGEPGAGDAVRQVVLLGAGLDARAWRLPPLLLPEQPAEQSAGEVAGGSGPRAEEPGDGGEEGSGGGEAGSGGGAAGSGGGALTFIELDSGSVEQLKMEVLGQPRGCRRVFRVADLSVPEQALEALSAAGHDPSRPTVFVAEGIIMYLTRPEGDGLLAALRSVAAPGSRLVMDGPLSPRWRDRVTALGGKLYMVTYEESQETLQRVQKAGWQARLLSASELGQKYGMPNNTVELILGTY